MKSKNTKLLPQVTVMNAILCLSVVMIHLTYAPLSELSKGTRRYISVFTLNKALSFCVPAFLFLSGLKLYKSYDRDIKSFYKRRFVKIAVPYIISALIYILYFQIKGWLEKSFLEYIFLGTISAHFYYVIITIQLYLLFPIIYKLFERDSGIVTAVSAMVTILCSVFLSFGLWDRFFGQYVFYFVLGMFWGKYEPDNKIKKLIPLLLLAYFAISAFHIQMLYSSSLFDTKYTLSQIFNIFYVTLSTVVLYVISENFLIKSKIITDSSAAVSNSSYSIYLYHCILIYILQFDILPKFELTCSKRFFISSAFVYTAIFIYCCFNGQRKNHFKKMSL